MNTFFADILLPLHLPNFYTYRIPALLSDQIKIGHSVVVEFGKKRLYSGLVRRIHQTPPRVHSVKYILSLIDETPCITETQFVFWEWMARYYVCYPGDVMAAALPAGFRLKSESQIRIHPEFDGEISSLSKSETEIVFALSNRKELSLKEIAEITGFQKIFPLLKTMNEKKIIRVEEEIEAKVKPKTETLISLSESYQNEENLRSLFNTLEQKKSTQKQVDILLSFLKKQTPEHFVEKNELLEGSLSPSAFNTLLKNGILFATQKIKSRLIECDNTSTPDQIHLNSIQESVFRSIQEKWHEKPVTLLHGVTSSGKTEIYIKLIQEILLQEKQVLFLLPEIALTVQLINRLRKYFGKQVGIYHSRFSIHERAEVWQKTAQIENGYQIILGARSSLFLPFHNLGLIIVDEEHDVSYKQLDPSPRYNARDSAIFLAGLYKSKTILGSATPSIESYYNATEGKYQLVEMKERYGGILMPEIWVADMKEAAKKKEIRSHFSLFLLEHIEKALEKKKQVILFQNRRGFALRLECDTCHWIPECKNCDVSLTYHKSINQQKCHYCGYSIPVPDKCPACGSSLIKMKGFGTEKLEEELAIYFPQAVINRMDLDTTRKKNAYEQILQDFEDRKIDILVGTQMITKGLDFENVSVVGIMSADNMISFPDFRSYERSFQQMVQVSGRAGRKGERGIVIIQTYNPYHQVIRDVIDTNYSSMYKSQIEERMIFKYPPFFRLIKIMLRHKDEHVLNEGAAFFATLLRESFSHRVMGPEFPLVSRIKNQYIKGITLRFEKDISYAQAKRTMNQRIESFLSQKKYSAITLSVDVDPY